MGRPSASASYKRDCFLTVPLRSEEKRRIEKVAERDGVSQATWARNLLLDALKRVERVA